ncbi:MAG: hypothetical protein ACI4E2_04450 [Acetatifactor sp.]
MKGQRSLRKIITIAAGEYSRWIRDPRGVLILVMMVFIQNVCLEPLQERAARYGEPMSIWEPFAAMGNSAMLIMILPAVFLVLMSDFPRMDGNGLFFLQRSGRRNWILGQMLFAAISAVTYLSVVLGTTLLLSVTKGSICLEWSETTRFYRSAFPEESDTFASLLLPPNLYNQITLRESIFFTLSLVFLYLYVLCMVLLLCKLYGKQALGMAACVGVIGAGLATCTIHGKVMWLFPTANAIIWLHFTEIRRKPVRPIASSYLYFGVCIIVLTILCFRILKRYDFTE